jgi:hypothetical protein
MKREILGITEKGSNQIIGNEQANTLNGGDVGGTDPNGKGIGSDTLTGGDGADLFVIGSQYQDSITNISAYYEGFTLKYRTDGDYAVITDFSSIDRLELSGTASGYFIGEAPTEFSRFNIRGRAPITSASTDFGIYAVTPNGPDLVAQVRGLALGGNLTVATVGGTLVDGTNDNLGGVRSTNATDGQNYLGVGMMYQLQGSDFANRVDFVA